MKDLEGLIGEYVSATGTCGIYKEKHVFGILSCKKDVYFVNFVEKDGSKVEVNVFLYSIKES